MPARRRRQPESRVRDQAGGAGDDHIDQPAGQARTGLSDQFRVNAHLAQPAVGLDPITGFLNRVGGLHAATRAVADAESVGSLLAVLWLDIDRLRQINGSFGHVGGDRAIAQVAGRLRLALSSDSLLLRMGSDEFVTLLPALQLQQAAEIGEMLLAEIEGPLLMLGPDATSRATAACSLRQAFPGSAHYERFWQASAQIAALSGWLAQSVRKPALRADDAYTHGLFRDCGIVILLRRFPNYTATPERANRDAERAFTDVESEVLPTNRSVVGALLAQNWWLPEEICQAIRNHHDRDAIEHFESGLPATSRYLVAASQTAEHILQQVSSGSYTEEWRKLGPSCLRLLGLDQAALTDLYEGCAAVMRSND